MTGATMVVRDHIEAFPEKHAWLLRQAVGHLGVSPNSPVTAAALDKAAAEVREKIRQKLAVQLADAEEAPKATIEEHSVLRSDVPVWKHKAACAGACWAEGKEVTADEYDAAVEAVDQHRFGGYRGR